MKPLLKLHPQKDPYTTPWSKKDRFVMLLWDVIWTIFCKWTPKPANRWRLFWLKIFGANIYGIPFVHQRSRIYIPWNLVLHDHACLGDRTNAYSLDTITIEEHATVAQEAYLCTGTHAFDRPSLDLVTGPIIIRKGAFVGARAFLLPGVTVGKSAIVGACSVVTRDVPDQAVVAGNPAKEITPPNLRPLTH